MDRRRFVGSAVLASLGPLASQLLSGCTPDEPSSSLVSTTTLSERETRTLFAVTRALFPHQDAPDQPYLDAVAALDSAAAGDEGVKALLTGAVDGLDRANGGDWLGATPEQKVETLEAQQGAPFFGLVLNTTIDALYRHPTIWALVGYEGSSLEQGGYLQRGFDDITWLPESASEVAR